MQKFTEPPPPDHLSAESKAIWTEVVTEFDLDGAGLAILLTGLDARDRMAKAKTTIDAEGESIVDRFGQKKVHPCCAVERDSRSGFLQAMKALNLDVPPTRDAIGRPPESERSI